MVNTGLFILGVLTAIVSGIFTNLGTLFQKKAVNNYLQQKIKDIHAEKLDAETTLQRINDIKIDIKVLVLQKTWLFGFSLQLIVATALYLASQQIVGPSLTPALGSFGLIVVVLASWMLNEKLCWEEYLGIFLMVGAVFMLVFGDLTINQNDIDFLEHGLVVRMCLYTGVIFSFNLVCKLYSYRRDKWEGICLATHSGLFVGVSNYWISPLTALGFDVILNRRGSNPTFTHPTYAVVLLIFFSAVLVVIPQIFCVYERQLAFRVGNAATMIPISHIPSHLSSPVIYSFVFMKMQKHAYSIALMWLAILLLLVCSFIFGKREAMMERMNKINISDAGVEIGEISDAKGCSKKGSCEIDLEKECRWSVDNAKEKDKKHSNSWKEKDKDHDVEKGLTSSLRGSKERSTSISLSTNKEDINDPDVSDP